MAADDAYHSALLIRSKTAARSQLANSLSTGVALAANLLVRIGALFFNDSFTATVYLELAATATIATSTVAIGPRSLYVLDVPYDGAIAAISDVANGTLHVTELT